MLTLIRLNIAFMLSLVSLALLLFVALLASHFYSGWQTKRYFASVTCSSFLHAVQSADANKIQTTLNHLRNIDSEAVEFFDEDLYGKKATFNVLIRGCYKQPNHTLRQIIAEGEGPSLAAQVADLYNTIDGELKTPTPMAPELYISPTEVISPTQPATNPSPTTPN